MAGLFCLRKNSTVNCLDNNLGIANRILLIRHFYLENSTSIDPKSFFTRRARLQRLNMGGQNACQGNCPAGTQYERYGLRKSEKN